MASSSGLGYQNDSGVPGFESGRYVVISKAGSLTQPLVFVFVGAFVFICAWLFPADLYAQFFGESNRLFLDLPTLGFVSACIGTTVLGICITGGLQLRSQPELYRPLSRWERSTVTMTGSLVCCFVLNLLALYAIYRTGALNAFIQALTTGSMRLIKQQRELLGDDESPVWIALLTPCSLMIPMIYHRARHFSNRDWRLWLFGLMVATYLLASVLAAKRNIIVRPLFGAMCVFLLYPSAKGWRRFSVKKGVAVAVVLAVVVLGLFLSLSYVRNGGGGLASSVADIGRYLICPYNTTAALVNGELKFPGSGTGSYWTQFIWQVPFLGEELSRLRLSWLGRRLRWEISSASSI